MSATFRNPMFVECYETSPAVRAGPSVALITNRVETRWLRTTPERVELQVLRHRVFAEQLNWLPPNGPSPHDEAVDDMLDELGLQTGVHFDGRLAVACRLTAGPSPFMPDRCFASLAPGPEYRRPDDLMISRLAVSGDQEPVLASLLIEHLLAQIYRYSLTQRIRRWVVITHNSLYLKLWRRLPFNCIQRLESPAVREPAIVAFMNLAVLEAVLSRVEPSKLDWFRHGPPAWEPRQTGDGPIGGATISILDPSLPIAKETP